MQVLLQRTEQMECLWWYFSSGIYSIYFETVHFPILRLSFQNKKLVGCQVQQNLIMFLATHMRSFYRPANLDALCVAGTHFDI